MDLKRHVTWPRPGLLSAASTLTGQSEGHQVLTTNELSSNTFHPISNSIKKSKNQKFNQKIKNSIKKLKKLKKNHLNKIEKKISIFNQKIKKLKIQ